MSENEWIAKYKQGKVKVIGVGVGSGLSAKGAVLGGADFLAVYHTAKYRISGLPTVLSLLPYDNCNQITIKLLPEIIANAQGIPVLAGLGAHDPRMPMEKIIGQVKASGAAGVVNEPFSGAYGKTIRKQLEQYGLGFTREKQLLKLAIKSGLLALGWAFSEEEAKELAAIGVPLVGIMIEDEWRDKDSRDMCEYICKVKESVSLENPESLLLVHGHPLEDRAVVQKVLDYTRADGYFTGSSGERIPAEQAIAAAVSSFKAM